MNRSTSRLHRGALALVAVLLAACGETYVDTSLLGDATTVPTEPAVTAERQLPPAEDTDPIDLSSTIERIDDALDRLSDAVAEDTELAADLLAAVESDWSLIEDGIRADHPEQLFGMQQAIDLARSAVTRKRPADASKAWKIVRDLTPSLT